MALQDGVLKECVFDCGNGFECEACRHNYLLRVMDHYLGQFRRDGQRKGWAVVIKKAYWQTWSRNARRKQIRYVSCDIEGGKMVLSMTYMDGATVVDTPKWFWEAHTKRIRGGRFSASAELGGHSKIEVQEPQFEVFPSVTARAVAKRLSLVGATISEGGQIIDKNLNVIMHQITGKGLDFDGSDRWVLAPPPRPNLKVAA